MINHAQARNEIRTHFYNAWRSGIANGLPNANPPVPPLNLKKFRTNETYIPAVQWQNVEVRSGGDNGVHWCRFYTQNIQTTQAAFGKRNRQRTLGILVVQLFFSKSSYKTSDEDALSLIAQNAFVGSSTPGGVWFRNSTIVELPPEETHFRCNVTAEYNYDSLKV